MIGRTAFWFALLFIVLVIVFAEVLIVVVFVFLGDFGAVAFDFLDLVAVWMWQLFVIIINKQNS